MFVPKIYRPEDAAWPAEIVRHHPLATLVMANGSAVMATHLPVILDPGQAPNPENGLNDVRLVGHLNRANPHWKTIEQGGNGLLIFQGPNGYISPTTYKAEPAAPTWNFVSVHIRGSIRALPQGEPTWRVIVSTVESLERHVGTGWEPTGSIDYLRGILPGVGAFEFQAAEASSMFKLSQEKPRNVRELVAESFADAEYTVRVSLAGLMRRVGA